jgi:hypothetical protein
VSQPEVRQEALDNSDPDDVDEGIVTKIPNLTFANNNNFVMTKKDEEVNI